MTLGVTAAFFVGVGVFAADGFTAGLLELVLARLLGAVATVRAGAGLTAAAFLIGAVGALVTALLAVVLAGVLTGLLAAVLLAVRVLVVALTVLALALVLALAVVRLLVTFAGALLEVGTAAFAVDLATGFLVAGLAALTLALAGAFTGALATALTGALVVVLLAATGLLTVLLVDLETVLTEFFAVLVLLEFLFELMGLGLFKKLLLFSNTTIQ